MREEEAQRIRDEADSQRSQQEQEQQQQVDVETVYESDNEYDADGSI